MSDQQPQTPKRQLPPLAFSLPRVSNNALGISSLFQTPANLPPMPTIPMTPPAPAVNIASPTKQKSQKTPVKKETESSSPQPEDEDMDDTEALDALLEKQMQEERTTTTTTTAKKTNSETSTTTPDPEILEERNRLRQILSTLTPEQEARYEKYKRSRFQTAAIKRVIQSICNTSVSQTVCIVMAGCAKLHVGDLVETSKIVMQEWGDVGPIQPKHLREAARRIKLKSSRKKFFIK